MKVKVEIELDTESEHDVEIIEKVSEFVKELKYLIGQEDEE